jgi:putative ABC transport system substrate-binding protein
MRRRDFIAGIAGSAAAWPLAVRAQQNDRMRRIGVLMNLTADDPEAAPRLVAFAQGLQEAGWAIGRNVRLDIRWGAGNTDKYRQFAAELVGLSPDILLASNTSTVRALRQAAPTLPIVFTSSVDPVGGGLVASLARPGGNITGFAAFEFGTSAKWLELLKQIKPDLKRAAVLRDSVTTGGAGQLGAIQSVAPALGVEVNPIDVHDVGQIGRSIDLFAKGATGGLIVTSSALADFHRKPIIELASRHRLPAVYPFRFFAVDGGLCSYGNDRVEPFRRAASYVGRILNGESPSDLPVQAPTKYELVVNLKTAKALGLDLPHSVLVRADEVIE